MKGPGWYHSIKFCNLSWVRTPSHPVCFLYPAFTSRTPEVFSCHETYTLAASSFFNALWQYVPLETTTFWVKELVQSPSFYSKKSFLAILPNVVLIIESRHSSSCNYLIIFSHLLLFKLILFLSVPEVCLSLLSVNSEMGEWFASNPKLGTNKRVQCIDNKITDKVGELGKVTLTFNPNTWKAG